MGYRNYLGSISKKEYRLIKNMSYDQLYDYMVTKEDNNCDMFEDSKYVPVYQLCERIFEFGKHCEFHSFLNGVPFFKNKDTQKYYNSDHEVMIVEKDFLKNVIEHYTNKVKNYYKELLKDIDINNKDTFTQNNFYKLWEHINSFNSEWNYLMPYNLEKGDEVTKSWKFEYEIFELVRIYKHFNYKKNLLVYYGW